MDPTEQTRVGAQVFEIFENNFYHRNCFCFRPISYLMQITQHV